MNSIFLSLVSILVSTLALVLGGRRAAHGQSLRTFKQTYGHLRTHYSDVNAEVLREPQRYRDAELPELTKAGWIPTKPLDLADVQIVLRPRDHNGTQFTQSLKEARKVLPRTATGSRYERYSAMLPELFDNIELYNGTIYRVLEMVAHSGRLELVFSEGKYFDHLDTSYVLALEVAVRQSQGKQLLNGPYRRHLSDPFDLTHRSPTLGINTLTIRRGADGCGFYVHQRSKENVTESPEVLHVVPAGEFTPSDVGLQALQTDFDLWRNIVREYAEEFLDVEEAYGRGGRPINFNEDTPFRDLMLARRQGGLSVHVLGMGFDPLDWKPSLFTVCVFEDATFDRIFDPLLRKGVPEVKCGKEGVIIVGADGRGTPFTKENVDLYAQNRNTVNAGVSCLQLAWRHRFALGLETKIQT